MAPPFSTGWQRKPRDALGKIIEEDSDEQDAMGREE